MAIVFMDYRRIGYTLADAFSSDPKAGKRNFTIDQERLPPSDPDELLQAARAQAPEGYELISLRIGHDPEGIIFEDKGIKPHAEI